MSELGRLSVDFFRRDAETVARDLVGRYLVRRVDGERLVLRIVETEAYLGVGDRASHAWSGRPTARTEVLYRRGGRAYVYLIYGLHHMFNVVTGSDGDGSAVLVRAGEPVEGVALMRARRGLEPAARGGVADGPGKLCQALAIDLRWNGSLLTRGALRIAVGRPLHAAALVRGPRVGVDYSGAAASWPLRFAERDNPEVSRPRPAAPAQATGGPSSM